MLKVGKYWRVFSEDPLTLKSAEKNAYNSGVENQKESENMEEIVK